MCIYFHYVSNLNETWNSSDMSKILRTGKKTSPKWGILVSCLFPFFSSLRDLLLFYFFLPFPERRSSWYIFEENKSASLTSHNIYYCKDTFFFWNYILHVTTILCHKNIKILVNNKIQKNVTFGMGMSGKHIEQPRQW